MVKDPAMPLYCNDWISSPTVLSMTPLEELAYFRMCLFCWQSGDVSITDDIDKLAILTRTDVQVCSSVVQTAFVAHPHKDDHLTNERVFSLWTERREYVEKKRLAGVKSGESRRRNKTEQVFDSVRTNANSSSYSSSSISSSSDKDPPNPPRGKPDPKPKKPRKPKARTTATAADPLMGVEVPPELDTERFRELWAMYIEHRVNMKKPMTPQAVKMAIGKLAKYPSVEDAIGAMEHSMGNGWTGIHSGDNNNGGKSADQLQQEALDSFMKDTSDDER